MAGTTKSRSSSSTQKDSGIKTMLLEGVEKKLSDLKGNHWNVDSRVLLALAETAKIAQELD